MFRRVFRVNRFDVIASVRLGLSYHTTGSVQVLYVCIVAWATPLRWCEWARDYKQQQSSYAWESHEDLWALCACHRAMWMRRSALAPPHDDGFDGCHLEINVIKVLIKPMPFTSFILTSRDTHAWLAIALCVPFVSIVWYMELDGFEREFELTVTYCHSSTVECDALD